MYKLKKLTIFMSEHSSADSAGPHPEAGCQLAGHLGVAGQMFP